MHYYCQSKVTLRNLIMMVNEEECGWEEKEMLIFYDELYRIPKKNGTFV